MADVLAGWTRTPASKGDEACLQDVLRYARPGRTRPSATGDTAGALGDGDRKRTCAFWGNARGLLDLRTRPRREFVTLRSTDPSVQRARDVSRRLRDGRRAQ